MVICTNSRSMTVLLVDDQPDVLDIHQQFLGKTGCTVLTARNGLEAFNIFEQKKNIIDLVITDYDMPEWNGMQLIRAIRRQYADAPILMITGFAEDNITKEADSFGVEILRKPVQFRTLSAFIHARSRQHINAKKSKKIQSDQPKANVHWHAFEPYHQGSPASD